ncbi:MAG TPA: ThiF family adenylyltransferase [Solirubrobacteraceae bacterium]|jgi:molybdopterin/thiamine biosynthesis adenylyltransferase|nr:ThiF family adenylyltransferase [Solirubrobacteraceae bacterium]
MPEPWKLTIDESMYDELMEHLFPGDDDEHGAVITAGLVKTERGTRLLARNLFLAEDGVDFVPGKRAYRMLTAAFVRERIRHCRDEQLVYLGIHNHGGRDEVDFSDPDISSHERGYPALLGIAKQPVGGLVIAGNAIAGDIWTADRSRRTISETTVLGRNIRRIYPSPPAPPRIADPEYDRQVRWLGQRGQDTLARAKVAVMGGGGVGLPLTTMLARLGVGQIVVIDPDRMEPENLPRMPEARRWDAMMALRGLPGAKRPAIKRILDRLCTRKIRLAHRAVRRANPKAAFIGIPKSVAEPDAARQLVDCDFIFLAADSHLARMIVNAVGHQYLIPVIQMGTRIDVNEDTGAVGEIRTNVRLILPQNGCIRCNGYIDSTKVQEDAISAAERERNRYIDEVPAPSVITFNTLSAAQGATDFLLMLGGLIDAGAALDYIRFRPRRRTFAPIRPVANRDSCPRCGTATISRRARGDSVELPLPER